MDAVLPLLFSLRNTGWKHAALLGKYGYVANQVQNPAVLSIMRHSFTTIPGVLWIVTAIVLFFYRLNKKRYNEIVEDLKKNRVK